MIDRGRRLDRVSRFYRMRGWQKMNRGGGDKNMFRG
jgi:hypothetical protein